MIGKEIHRDNLMSRDNKHVIPLRLYSHFFAVPSQIAVDMTIKLYIKNDASKLFESIGNLDNELRADLDTQNPAVFLEAPKLN